MRSCFQVIATDEQIEYASDLVEYSIKNHTVPNIWDIDKNKKEQTPFLRFIGSLGETVFADAYNLPRHKKSFGASDGQDYGNDFIITINGVEYVVDLKSMHRKNDTFYGFYVLNIPSNQLHKSKSVTDLYYCISIHFENEKYAISFLGLIRKTDILEGKVGILYKTGTTRVRADKTTFRFISDTYEVEFKDFLKPFISEHIKKMNGFKLIKIK